VIVHPSARAGAVSSCVIRRSAVRYLCIAFLICLAVVLAGCVTQPRRAPEGAAWEVRRAQLQQREQFDLRGRVAVAAGQDGFNARMRWLQNGSHSQLWLDGPLGVGGAQVSLDEGALSVRNSKGESLSDAAARTELETRLGFDPPLRSLRYWIQGVPDPAAQAEETLDDQQRLAALVQDGWRISYTGYRASGDEWLPERLTLQRESVRVRVLIDSWSP
jgi:outer membrane lipoprotein LolB